MDAAPRSSSALRVLIADADADARSVLRSALEERIARPLMVMETGDAASARVLAAGRNFDVIAADLATLGGPHALTPLLSAAGDTTLYALGPSEDVTSAVTAVQVGAADYLSKPLDGAAFARRVERQFGQSEAVHAEGFDGMLGRSESMRTLFEAVGRVAPSLAPVFVSGPTGSGKSTLARVIHGRSRRKHGPFVEVDCTGQESVALCDTLAAIGGAFDRAHGGTLHLKEISRLSPAVQALLLRLVDSGEVLGSGVRRRLSVRLVVSTSEAVQDGKVPGTLKPDLYFRLAVLPLRLPALAARTEDIPLIALEALRRAARERGARSIRLLPAAESALMAFGWPDNVAGLKRACETLAEHAVNGVIGPEAVAAVLAPAGFVARTEATGAAQRPIIVRPLHLEEARIIEEAIAAFDGNIARAAAALQISPSTIYRKRRGREGSEAGYAESAAG
ncbi:sigma-54-dependent transcriptional regulator [Chthonobacter albigriseus]|uniref:sigma-54-dependent transcriptional regulator n=1 Tax=Chthonobacter albigriseus TaxID=1683161 RepID=UPI0015EFD81C|nr:sigma 54-interacting transcriptional regulator [Chthonobacter albigriseus]